MRSLAAVAAGLLILAGCGGSDSSTSTNAAPGTDGSSSPATEPNAAPTTLVATTTTVDPTIFDPTRIGDIRELDSFVYTIDESHVANGTPSSKTTTIGYIKEPFAAYVVSDLGEFGAVTEYQVAGRFFQRDHQNFWTIYESGSLATPDILSPLDVAYTLSQLLTAQFVGEVAFADIAAYHFTFDETNLYGSTEGIEAEGEVYLAKDGNYPLYVHLRLVATGPGFELIDEYTETISQPNQLTEIALPPDMAPLQEAFEQGIALGIPMPADGVLDSLVNYNEGGIGVYYYEFTSSWDNEAEFIGFYQALPPTNGWTVTHIGQVKNLDAHCLDGNCVLISNGAEQVILYFDGINLHADWDREHRFSAQ